MQWMLIMIMMKPLRMATMQRWERLAVVGQAVAASPGLQRLASVHPRRKRREKN